MKKQLISWAIGVVIFIILIVLMWRGYTKPLYILVTVSTIHFSIHDLTLRIKNETKKLRSVS